MRRCGISLTCLCMHVGNTYQLMYQSSTVTECFCNINCLPLACCGLSRNVYCVTFCDLHFLTAQMLVQVYASDILLLLTRWCLDPPFLWNECVDRLPFGCSSFLPILSWCLACCHVIDNLPCEMRYSREAGHIKGVIAEVLVLSAEFQRGLIVTTSAPRNPPSIEMTIQFRTFLIGLSGRFIL